LDSDVGASVTAGWENFLVAEAGASAALTGLLFVAVSINLTRILSFPHLPGRAAQALMVFLSVLLVTTCGLVPAQSARALGAEILAIGALGVLGMSWLQIRDRIHVQRRYWVVSLLATSQLPLIPFVVCGVLLLRGSQNGLYWLLPGTLLSFVAGVLHAWVLLVEILR
jgi:hypothetical protein